MRSVALKKFTKEVFSVTDFDAFVSEVRHFASLRHPNVVALVGACIVRHLARLRHPNVVAFVGACVEKASFCIVTELVPNGNLHAVLKRKGAPIPWMSRIRMGMDVAEAIRFLHAQTPSVLHLDIKSPNLLVGNDLSVKLADFGLAVTDTPDNTQRSASGFQPGTVHWMAPELMIRGEKHRGVDLYALAVVLWEIWTQRTPYAGLKVKDIADKAHTEGSTVEYDALMRQCWNPEYDVLMRECWAEDTTKRPSAAEATPPPEP
ncbi:kinase-like domain-containing protein [Baffinella frigidus]|nr:kinase-like domain-containing protein [Cryptophyta sp. CCMP2293]